MESSFVIFKLEYDTNGAAPPLVIKEEEEEGRENQELQEEEEQQQHEKTCNDHPPPSPPNPAAALLHYYYCPSCSLVVSDPTHLKTCCGGGRDGGAGAKDESPQINTSCSSDPNPTNKTTETTLTPQFSDVILHVATPQVPSPKRKRQSDKPRPPPPRKTHFKCPHCPKHYLTRSSFNSHQQVTHGASKAKCRPVFNCSTPSCQYTTFTPSALAWHVRRLHHAKTELPPQITTSSSSDPIPRTLPKRPTTKKYKMYGEYICTICGTSFNSRASYKRHLKLKECGVNGFCDSGDRSRSDTPQLLRLPKKIFKCTMCDHTSTRGYNLERHLQARHPPPPSSRPPPTKKYKMYGEYICTVCGAPFKSRAKLRRHLVLKECGGADVVNGSGSGCVDGSLILLPLPKKIFKCTLCDYASHRGYNLERHVQAMHGHSRVVSSEKSFKKELNLKHHSRKCTNSNITEATPQISAPNTTPHSVQAPQFPDVNLHVATPTVPPVRKRKRKKRSNNVPPGKSCNLAKLVNKVQNKDQTTTTNKQRPISFNCNGGEESCGKCFKCLHTKIKATATTTAKSKYPQRQRGNNKRKSQVQSFTLNDKTGDCIVSFKEEKPQEEEECCRSCFKCHAICSNETELDKHLLEVHSIRIIDV